MTHKRVVALAAVVWVVSASLSLIMSLSLQIGDPILVVILVFVLFVLPFFIVKFIPLRSDT